MNKSVLNSLTFTWNVFCSRALVGPWKIGLVKPKWNSNAQELKISTCRIQTPDSKCWATKFGSNHNRFHLGIEILLCTPQNVIDSGTSTPGRSFQNVEQGQDWLIYILSSWINRNRNYMFTETATKLQKRPSKRNKEAHLLIPDISPTSKFPTLWVPFCAKWRTTVFLETTSSMDRLQNGTKFLPGWHKN